jgi:hypothetical protein
LRRIEAEIESEDDALVAGAPHKTPG